MNLEIELLKKDIQYLKNELAILKQHIVCKDLRKYFKITFTTTGEKSLEIEPILYELHSKIPLDNISCQIEQYEDTTYYTTLIPNLKLYNIHVTLFIITKNTILPLLIEQQLNIFPGIKKYTYYTNEDEFFAETSKYKLKNYVYQ